MDTKYVVVIGAGLAGLSAARRLAGEGQNVLIVEARDRPGGRVHTLFNPGWPVPIESGAEFVHGDVPELDEAISQAGGKTHEVADNHWWWFDGRLQPFDFNAVWDPVAEDLKRYSGPDISFAQFLRDHSATLSPQNRELARSYVEGFNAADFADVSIHWLRSTDQAVGAGGGAPVRIANGFSTVVDRMVWALNEKKIEIRFATEARLVRWQPGHVELETDSSGRRQTVEAGQIVVTIPLGMLQAPAGSPGALQFEPDISDKRQLWQQLKMGAVVKLVLCFCERVWPKELGFLHTPEEAFETWWTTEPMESGVLTGWIGGPRAARLAKGEPRAVLGEALTSLSKAFAIPRLRLEDQLKDWRLFDWQADPFSRGAYMYVPVGQCSIPGQLALPVDNTLFFAGEATELKLAGTTGGAMLSGERAAKQVLSLRRN